MNKALSDRSIQIARRTYLPTWEIPANFPALTGRPQNKPDASSSCFAPATGFTHPNRYLVNASFCGLSFVSCRWKSSTLPIRRILSPGNPELTRYMSEPHVEQKKFVIVLPEATVWDWLKVVRLSRPRRCCRYLSSTVKLEAKAEAVILWQSGQLQTKVLTSPGGSVGCGRREVVLKTVILEGRKARMGEGVGGTGDDSRREGLPNQRGAGRSRIELVTAKKRDRLTNASCTAPQRHVAVASSSLDQPSFAKPARGK